MLKICFEAQAAENLFITQNIWYYDPKYRAVTRLISLLIKNTGRPFYQLILTEIEFFHSWLLNFIIAKKRTSKADYLCQHLKLLKQFIHIRPISLSSEAILDQVINYFA